jgi:hypothetical protein
LRRRIANTLATIAASPITTIVTINGADDAAGAADGTLVAGGTVAAAVGVTATIVVGAVVAVAAAVVEVAAEVDVAAGAVDANTNTAAVRPGTVNVPESILKSVVCTTGSLDACWMGCSFNAKPAKAASAKV